MLQHPNGRLNQAAAAEAGLCDMYCFGVLVSVSVAPIAGSTQVTGPECLNPLVSSFDRELFAKTSLNTHRDPKVQRVLTSHFLERSKAGSAVLVSAYIHRPGCRRAGRQTDRRTTMQMYLDMHVCMKSSSYHYMIYRYILRFCLRVMCCLCKGYEYLLLGVSVMLQCYDRDNC